MAQVRPQKSQQEYERDRDERNKAILQQLHNGDLEGKVTIILILGPSGAGKTNLLKVLTGEDLPVGHRLESGTTKSWCILTERFLYIDTPGFGHPDLPVGEVQTAIYNTLGYFTRRLGGIHGVLYLHDIRNDRLTPGMRESFRFLEKLTTHCPVIFITTGWDLIVPKERPKCEERECELQREWSTKFRIDNYGAQGYCYTFQFGCSWEDDTQEEKEETRRKLYRLIYRMHGLVHGDHNRVGKLNMPFREWAFLGKGEGKAREEKNARSLVPWSDAREVPFEPSHINFQFQFQAGTPPQREVIFENGNFSVWVSRS